MFTKLNNSDTILNCETKIWQGPFKEQKFGLSVSLGSSIQKSLINQPDHISQICDNNGKYYTNEQILTMSIRIAQNLEEIGIQQNDVVGICASNTDFVAPLVFGTLFIGATLSTLDPSLHKDSVRHVLNKIIPKIIFCDGGIYQVIKESLAEINTSVQIFTMKDHLEGVRRIEELICPTGKEELYNLKPLKDGSRQTAAILCSSGTTGLPKLISMSHESLVNGFFKLTNVKTLFCYSTLYWISGINSLLHGTMNGCTRVITDQSFSPEHFLKTIELYKVDFTLSSPSYMAMAVNWTDFPKRNLSSLKTYITSGNAVPSATIQKFCQHLKECQMIVAYGLSEVCGSCCFGIPSKPGDTGKLKPNFTVKILDNDDGKKKGINEIGEICIKPPFPWAGYYKYPETTNEIYDQEGFIHSGDLGFFDESGSLFVIGRKKDILKYNENVYFFPSEIEEVLMDIPNVVEVCVVGISNDIESSLLISAAVVKVCGSNLTEEDICKQVARKMPHFKHLHGGVYFMDSLPKTPSGKIIRANVSQAVKKCVTRKRNTNDCD